MKNKNFFFLFSGNFYLLSLFLWMFLLLTALRLDAFFLFFLSRKKILTKFEPKKKKLGNKNAIFFIFLRKKEKLLFIELVPLDVPALDSTERARFFPVLLEQAVADPAQLLCLLELLSLGLNEYKLNKINNNLFNNLNNIIF